MEVATGMKFYCGPDYKAQIQWHKFYPWLPRRTGEDTCHMFEWIERKGELRPERHGDDFWRWKYREIED